MSLRKILYNALAGTPALTAVIPSARFYEASSLGSENGFMPIKPFLVYRTALNLAALATHLEDRLFEIWVYDEPGSYDQIDNAHKIIKGILDRRAGDVLMVGAEKWSLLESHFQSSSADLRDETLRAIVRYGTYRVVGSVTSA